MLYHYRVDQIGESANHLRLNTRIPIGPGQLEQLVSHLRSADVGQYPDGVQPATDADLRLAQRLPQCHESGGALALDGGLSITSFVGAVRIELCNPVGESGPLRTRLGCVGLVPGVSDTIDAA